MKASIAVLGLSASASAFVAPAGVARSTLSNVRMDAMSDLKTTAQELNPVVGYYDPLNLADRNFWEQGNEATIGWLRHSEIKHGRVAMAGFVGYCVHASGFVWPWPMNFKGESFPTGLSPPEAWDSLPDIAKLQIVLAVGVLEAWSEGSFILESEGQKHYMRGGKPGYFPTFDKCPHPLPLNLWDPYGFMGNMSPEQKARGLNVEINNGRLAMLGLFGFLSAAKVPGSVPALGFIPSYSGDFMIPFSADFWTI